LRPEAYSVEDIANIYIETCERLYGPMNHESYFRVENKSVGEVRNEILSSIENTELAKSKYLDMSLYVLQTDKDVFIKVS
jgi:hypothetical protein